MIVGTMLSSSVWITMLSGTSAFNGVDLVEKGKFGNMYVYFGVW